jgi:6-methylsalicylate decarboxylase
LAVLPRTDVHRHLWAPDLLAALARRSEAPCARRRDGTWWLQVAGEPASVVPAQDPGECAAALGEQGVDRALLSLSTALEVERLPRGEAIALLDAWRAVVRELPEALGAWGTLQLADAGPEHVDALLDEGFVGLCLPARALAEPRCIETLGAVLGRLESRGAPLFVHPGPVADDAGGAPWWPAVTGYTASLQAAWWAWAAVGLTQHPRLRVVFAALAGLAPLHGERAAARGGPPVPDAPQLFYDTSSYGPQAVAMMRRAVGAAQLVHGTDAPVLAAAVAPDDEALLRANPARLLG